MGIILAISSMLRVLRCFIIVLISQYHPILGHRVAPVTRQEGEAGQGQAGGPPASRVPLSPVSFNPFPSTSGARS